MADNITGTDHSGGEVTLATHENGGVHVPKTALAASDGADIDAGNPLPVALAVQPLTTIPDNQASGLPVRPIGQDTWTCSFTDSGASVLSSDFTLRRQGTGIGYSQASGLLLVTTGTSANAEFLARSTVAWRSAMTARCSTVLSQRIANNNFMFLLADSVGEGLACTINGTTSISVTKTAHGFTSANVGQFMFVGAITGANGVPGRYAIASVPDANTINFTVAGWPASGSCTVDLFGHSYVKWHYDGTTETSAKIDAQRKGWASGDTTVAVSTTAAPGHIAQVQNAGRELYYSDFTRASSLAPLAKNRGTRVENIPDDNLDLYLYLWAYNGSTNPASTTTWTVGFASVEKFALTPVHISGAEIVGPAAAIPVYVAYSTNLVIGSGSVTNTPVTPTQSFINSTASTNATSVKNSAGTVWSIVASNTNAAARYVKLYNKASAPTVGTDTPVMVITIPAGQTVNIHGGSNGIRFGTGIALAITTGMADSDATSVAADEIKVATAYT